MAHSIELLLDQRADADIRRIWDELVDARLPSQQRVRSDTNRPHITVLAAERISPDVDAVLAGLADHFPIHAVLGAPLVFGGARLTLARSVVTSSALLALHEQIVSLAQPHVATLFAHSRPGEWTPHVTLGRRFTSAQVGDALTIDGLAADIDADIVSLRRWDSDARTEHILIN